MIRRGSPRRRKQKIMTDDYSIETHVEKIYQGMSLTSKCGMILMWRKGNCYHDGFTASADANEMRITPLYLVTCTGTLAIFRRSFAAPSPKPFARHPSGIFAPLIGGGRSGRTGWSVAYAATTPTDVVPTAAPYVLSTTPISPLRSTAPPCTSTLPRAATTTSFPRMGNRHQPRPTGTGWAPLPRLSSRGRVGTVVGAGR